MHDACVPSSCTNPFGASAARASACVRVRLRGCWLLLRAAFGAGCWVL